MYMKRYFKNRFGQLIELDINYNYLKGELQRVNIFLVRKGNLEFLHTLFFSNEVILDQYRLVELSDSNAEINISDAWLDQPFYLFCSATEIEEFKVHYPRVLTLREEISNSGAAFMA